MKILRHIPAIIGRIMLIGFSVQIVLGLIWMCGAFVNVQQFGESAFYIEASKSLLCDEYTGALYPVLLMLTRGMEELLPIPHTYMVFCLQLVVAILAGYRFLGEIGGFTEKLKKNEKKSRRSVLVDVETGEKNRTPEKYTAVKELCGNKKIYNIWGSLALLTFPMTMQCHMAILPNSLASSCFLLEMSYLVKAMRSKEGFQAADVAKACTGWLLAALLLPEYFYLGAVPLVLGFLYDVLRECRMNRRDEQYPNVPIMK